MKNFSVLLVLLSFIFIESSFSRFCSPVQTPFDKLVNGYNPQFNSAVEGYFISENKFKITHSFDSNFEVGSEKKVFEYGPFGSQCEMYEMGSNADKNILGAKHPRLLFLYKDRSKNGKLVTPIFHGEGVSILNQKKVIFDKYISTEKSPYSQKYQFSTNLASLRNIFQQKSANTNLNWERKLVKQ